jgi:hypothetical protein
MGHSDGMGGYLVILAMRVIARMAKGRRIADDLGGGGGRGGWKGVYITVMAGEDLGTQIIELAAKSTYRI